MKKHELRKMPKEPIEIVLPPIKAKLDHDFDRFSNGGLRMSFIDCKADVIAGKKTLGSVTGVMGGGVMVQKDGRQWYIGPLEIWRAVVDAEKQYTKGVCRK